MKKKIIFSLGATVLFAMFILSGCNVSTANLSGLKTATDKEGKSATTKFKAEDTFYGIATISNNPGTVKVKMYLTDPQGNKQMERTVEVQGDGSAFLTMPASEGSPGEHKFNAEMLNEAGEKKDSKTISFSFE